MTALRRARHLRRRGWRLRVALSLAAVVLLACGLATMRVVQIRRQRIDVTLVVGGAPRPVRVTKPATVAEVLDADDLVPRPGRLLSLVTKQVLDPAVNPVQLTVDGRPATPDTPVLAGSAVGVVEPEDVVEELVEGGDAIPAPPMPTVIHGLWHPGQPGRSMVRKGAVSSEVVAQREVQATVPPAPVTGKLVALTFDDGPFPATPEVLRILREKNVKATFCVVTRQLKGQGLAWAKGAVAEGHRLCNHTTDHDQKLPGKPQKVIDENIKAANRHLVERTGAKPAYYRPPGGRMGPGVEATVKAEGQQVLLWTVDTKDYQKPPPEAIIGAVMGNVQPGGVVLLHDGGGDRASTVAALPALIDQLRGAGYELVLPDSVPPVPAAPVDPAAVPS